jgi:hypothetical protein
VNDEELKGTPHIYSKNAPEHMTLFGGTVMDT